MGNVGDHGFVMALADPAKPGADGELIPGKTNYGTFFDATTAVAASSLDLLKQALDVLDGKAESLAKTKALPMLPKPVAGEFIVAVASGVPMPTDKPGPQAAIFRSASVMSFQAGEDDEGTFAELIAVAEDAEKAMRVRNIIKGLVALMQIQLAEREDLPLLYEKVVVGGEDSEVRVSLTVPTESLIEMFKFLQDKKAAAMRTRPAGRDAETDGPIR